MKDALVRLCLELSGHGAHGQAGQDPGRPPAGPSGLEQLTGMSREAIQRAIIGKAADVKALQGRTVRVNMTSANTLETKKDQIARYMDAYKETIDYMYSSPEALSMYADLAGVPLPIAEKIKTLIPKESTNPDQIIGMDSIMTEAVATKFLTAPLTPAQIAELVQMKNPPKP